MAESGPSSRARSEKNAFKHAVAHSPTGWYSRYDGLAPPLPHERWHAPRGDQPVPLREPGPHLLPPGQCNVHCPLRPVLPCGWLLPFRRAARARPGADLLEGERDHDDVLGGPDIDTSRQLSGPVPPRLLLHALPP